MFDVNVLRFSSRMNKPIQIANCSFIYAILCFKMLP